MNEPIIAFNSGELSPLIDCRSDMNKYSAGCRICENLIPLVYGCAERRPGTEFIDECYSTGTSRLIPFIYSNSISYVIEMSEGIFRFYYDGGVVLDDDDNEVTVVTPYVAEDLFEIQYAQSIDVMWLVHKDYAPRKLNRVSASEFTLEEIDFVDGPFRNRNDWEYDNDIALDCSVIAKDAVGTLTATGPMSPVEVFQPGHVGALFKLTLPRILTSTGGDNSAPGILGVALDVEGPFTFVTHGNWSATVELQRNEDSNGWETFRKWVSITEGGAGTLNAQYTSKEYGKNVQYRINITAWVEGKVSAWLTVNSSTQTGIVKVLSVNDNDSAIVKVLTKLPSTSATKQWHEGSWSDVRGYPKTVTFYQDRCIYAGTPTEPQTIWLSQSGAYDVIT